MSRKPFDLQNYLERSIKRVWNWYPPKSEARKRAQVGKDLFECASCGDGFARKETHVDHIEPVIPLSGWVDWNMFIARLFCSVDNLQVLCKACHKEKTNKENQERRFDWRRMK